MPIKHLVFTIVSIFWDGNMVRGFVASAQGGGIDGCEPVLVRGLLTMFPDEKVIAGGKFFAFMLCIISQLTK